MKRNLPNPRSPKQSYSLTALGANALHDVEGLRVKLQASSSGE